MSQSPKRTIWRYILGGAVVILVILHVSLPFVVRRYVLHTLNKIPEYHAEIGRIYVNLFRGAYQIRDLKLEKTSGAVPVPFLSALTIDLSVQWTELFHGAVVGEIEVNKAALNFVNSPSPETSQVSMDKDWVRRVKELFPLKINRFEVKNSDIHFRDFQREPKVDLYMTKTHIVAVNFTNSRRLSHTFIATMDAEGVIPDTAKFKFHLEADPFAPKPTFKLAAEMTDVDLTQWNDFLKSYGGVTAEDGTFSVFTEMNVEQGELDGYIKPIFKHVKVARWKEAHENPLKVLWEHIVAGMAELLKNHPKDEIATRIPLAGSLDRPDAGILATVGELLRNAYIQALFPGLEGFVH